MKDSHPICLDPKFQNPSPRGFQIELGTDVYYSADTLWGGYVCPNKALSPPSTWNLNNVHPKEWQTVGDAASGTGSYSTTRSATEKDWKWAAEQLGVEVALVKAFAEVESNKKGFWPSGKPKIRIEYWRLKKQGSPYRLQTQEGEDASKKVDEIETRAKMYKDEDERRWYAFEELRKHDEVGVIISTSFGMFQMLGALAKPDGTFDRVLWASDIEYRRKSPSPSSRDSAAKLRNALLRFFDAMCTNERTHLEYFVAYCKAKKKLHSAMQTLQWAQMSSCYNGPEYMKNGYDIKLAKAYLGNGGSQVSSARNHISNPAILRAKVTAC